MHDLIITLYIAAPVLPFAIACAAIAAFPPRDYLEDTGEWDYAPEDTGEWD